MMLSRYLFTVVGLLLLCSNNAQTCSNGVAGVEGFSMCCVAECGICGGDGCRKRAEAAFLTPEDCCTTNIEASGVYCDDSQSAPCIIDSTDETCSNGLSGVEGYGMCCDAECGTCGGFECHERAEAALLTPDDCCVQNIRASGVYCDDSQSAPCIIGGSNETTCSNGLSGVEGFGMCCNADCGTCGGKKCNVQAREAGLTPDDCCATNIIASGVYCDDSESAPCIMGVISNETCSNGLSGVEGFGMCCNADCGICGGKKCDVQAREAGLAPDDCCATNIIASGVYCDDSESAPCIMGVISNETCSNGLSGVEGFGMCCNADCGTCGGKKCNVQAREAGLTPDDCCATNIIASGVYCDDSESAPCIMGVISNETCSNGLSGVEGFGMCCNADCGTCGGWYCNRRAVEAALTPDDCCATNIRASGVYCEDSQSAPCIMAKSCSNGLDGVEDYGMCCTAECGICGGEECHTQARLFGLTPDDCCVTNIRASGVYCDDSQSAPCIIGGNNKTCSNGLSGVEGFGMCCHAECGTCGGEGCPERARLAALNLDDCCVQHIRAFGVYCDDSQSAPCIIGGSDE